MLNRQTQLIIMLIVALFWQALPVLADNYASSTYIIRDPVLSEGGTHYSSSTNFEVRSTIGGVEAIGVSTSTSYEVRSGFQYYDDSGPDITAAVVNDGGGADIDQQSAINTLSANWSGFVDNESGLRPTNTYAYAFRRTTDGYFWSTTSSAWQAGEAWYYTSNSYATIIPVYLRTSQTFYVSVKAYNNLDIASLPVNSDGVKVIETLTFSLSSFSASFNTLDPGNNFTALSYTTTTVSTNAYNGYVITAWETGPMTHQINSFFTIPDWPGTNAVPTAWAGSCSGNDECGFGYKTNDTSLSGGLANRFASGNDYAGFVQTGAGDPVADHTDNIDGSTGEVVNQQFLITYKISSNASQAAGPYATTIVYVATANY